MAQASGPKPEPPQSEGLSRDDLFDVLSNVRRRCIIQYISEQGEAVELGDLVDHVAAWENDKPVSAVTSPERKRVYSALQQTHLPKMDELELVEYDREENVIEIADEFSDLNVYLQVVGGTVPYSIVYLLLNLVGLGLLAAKVLALPVVGSLPTLGLAGTVVALFGVTALVHLYHTRKMKLVPEFADLLEG